MLSGSGRIPKVPLLDPCAGDNQKRTGPRMLPVVMVVVAAVMEVGNRYHPLTTDERLSGDMDSSPVEMERDK